MAIYHFSAKMISRANGAKYRPFCPRSAGHTRTGTHVVQLLLQPVTIGSPTRCRRR
jgi:hypothetical protein